jgi:hypothetical protein
MRPATSGCRDLATHSITTSYGGDAIDLASASAGLTQTVKAADFTIAANPGTVSVSQVQSATITLTITPQGSFATPVSFSCANLPALASCTFSPVSITPNSNAATTTVTVTTVGSSPAAMPVPIGGWGNGLRIQWPIWISTISLLVLAFFAKFSEREKWKLHIRNGVAACALLFVLGAVGGCAGSGSRPMTPTGTTQVQIIAATSGSAPTSHSATVTVTVTP